MDVVLCWHMHQPEYRVDGRYIKPWTWLHAIKDYTDMAAHLESVPGARAVVNFSPVLIEQLQDYPRRIRALLENGEPVGDPLLDALGAGEIQAGEALRAQLLRVNEARMKDRFEPYARLFDRARAGEALDRDELADMVVWYVIAWLGESLRDMPLARDLARRQRHYDVEDRRELLALLADVIDGILPRYRKLARGGFVELSVTPYAHPILPLLLDFESAREALPGAALPEGKYAGGEARCHWHLGAARTVFEATFGMAPAGCWPSEGALSEATLGLLAQHEFRWTASGSQVLRNTLQRAGWDAAGLPHHHAWRQENGPACIFRDDGLSDLIAFEYSKWQAGDAVNDFVARLEKRREECREAGNEQPLLAIIMDGENAWEYFENNGWDFLQKLYTRLAEHPALRLTTFSDALKAAELRTLPPLCAGSWVHGSLSTWIGDAAKNRAWSLLIEAKRAVDAALESSAESVRPDHIKSVLRQLAICEASDWFWWPGEGERLQDAPEFDALFRRNLRTLYGLLHLEPPAALDRPIGSRTDEFSDQTEDLPVTIRRSTSPGNSV